MRKVHILSRTQLRASCFSPSDRSSWIGTAISRSVRYIINRLSTIFEDIDKDKEMCENIDIYKKIRSPWIEAAISITRNLLSLDP